MMIKYCAFLRLEPALTAHISMMNKIRITKCLLSISLCLYAWTALILRNSSRHALHVDNCDITDNARRAEYQSRRSISLYRYIQGVLVCITFVSSRFALADAFSVNKSAAVSIHSIYTPIDNVLYSIGLYRLIIFIPLYASNDTSYNKYTAYSFSVTRPKWSLGDVSVCARILTDRVLLD